MTEFPIWVTDDWSKLDYLLVNFQVLSGTMSIKIAKEFVNGCNKSTIDTTPYLLATKQIISDICNYYSIPVPQLYMYRHEGEGVPPHIVKMIERIFNTVRQANVEGLPTIFYKPVGGAYFSSGQFGVLAPNGLIIVRYEDIFETTDPWNYEEIPIHELAHHIFNYKFLSYVKILAQQDPERLMKMNEEFSNSFVDAMEDQTKYPLDFTRYVPDKSLSAKQQQERFETWKQDKIDQNARTFAKYVKTGPPPTRDELDRFNKWWENNSFV